MRTREISLDQASAMYYNDPLHTVITFEAYLIRKFYRHRGKLFLKV